MSKRFLMFLCFLPFTFRCNLQQDVEKNNSIIQLGRFRLPVPIGWKYRKLNSIDSEAGEMIRDSFKIGLDNSYLPLFSMQTEQDYIEKKLWLPDFFNQVMPVNVTYRPDTLFKYVQIKEIDVTNRSAKLTYKGKSYSYKIGIPDYLMGVSSRIDTIEGIIRRFIFPTNATDSSNYKFYLINTRKYNESMSAYESLLMQANHVRVQDTTFLIQVFHSIEW